MQKQIDLSHEQL